MKNRIYPCIWYTDQAKDAALFYGSVFKKFKITFENQFVVNFELHGQTFMAMNGGPAYTPNPSISFFVVFESSSEIEQAWNQLLDGGSTLMPFDQYDWSEKYGWLQDRYGVNWQLSLGRMEEAGQKFTPSLMFTREKAGKAVEAIKHYTSIFENSSIVGILNYSKADGDTEGFVKHAQFKLNHQVFMAMDSSLDHGFVFNEGVSLVVECDTQEQIDYYWKNLTKDGAEGQCGWLKDKFGVSWQIIPAVLKELMSMPDKSERVIQAFLQMKKFDIEQLKHA